MQLKQFGIQCVNLQRSDSGHRYSFKFTNSAKQELSKHLSPFTSLLNANCMIKYKVPGNFHATARGRISTVASEGVIWMTPSYTFGEHSGMNNSGIVLLEWEDPERTAADEYIKGLPFDGGFANTGSVREAFLEGIRWQKSRK